MYFDVYDFEGNDFQIPIENHQNPGLSLGIFGDTPLTFGFTLYVSLTEFKYILKIR